MATQTFPYDHPEYNVTRGDAINLSAVDASTVAGKFIAFATTRVKSIQCNINIAGTNDAAGYDVFNGTTSIGAFVTGTNTAGVAPTKLTLSAAAGALNPAGYLAFKTKANSATLSASVMVEYEITNGAAVSL